MANSTVEDLAAYFASCGLASNRALDSAKSKQASTINALFRSNSLETKGLSDKQALLASQVARDGGKLGETERAVVVDAVVDGKLKSSDQVLAAIKYLTTNPGPVDAPAFNFTCGVGFTSTPEETEIAVRAYVAANNTEIQSTKWNSIHKTFSGLKLDPNTKWINALELKSTAEKVYVEMFGEKVVEDKAAIAAKAKAIKDANKAAKESAIASAVPEAPTDMFATGFLSRLHKAGGNTQPIPERMEEHLAFTKGKVFTRFPPEPNGFLHIGHSKAIAVNFGFAKYHGGNCYLRFDDTNPEAEEQIYFDKILEAVRWLGYEPYKITHSSDHFQELYDLAVLLIKKGLAYTSTDTAEEIQFQRGGKEYGPRTESKDRHKPIAQSLEEFQAMKDGKYKPGEITLRMKQDLESSNPVMWDIIAYRILETPHHRTGRDWCIYPTYDFTHCLCDSFENITHSLCTTEFIGARTVYEWVCDSLERYKPQQSEYGRLNLEGTVMSKRKLLRLVKEGHVTGWDDPRLYTLVALKRRGVPPSAIISFVSGLGVSTMSSNIELSRFEQTVRANLESTTPRLLMLLDPILITIENLPDDYHLPIEKGIHSKIPAMGTNVVPFTKRVYIDADDFRSVADEDFYRLAPGGSVGLLHVPFPITYLSHEIDDKGKVTSIKCRYENDPTTKIKPKAYIQWIAEHAPSGSPVKMDETRIFKRLFKSDDPASLGDGYIADIDPDSLVVVKSALLEVGVWPIIKTSLETTKAAAIERGREAREKGTNAPPLVDGVESIRFQGVRVAYFCFDLDSKAKAFDGTGSEGAEGDRLVLNMIAPLKQDAGKKA